MAVYLVANKHQISDNSDVCRSVDCQTCYNYATTHAILLQSTACMSEQLYMTNTLSCSLSIHIEGQPVATSSTRALLRNQRLLIVMQLSPQVITLYHLSWWACICLLVLLLSTVISLTWMKCAACHGAGEAVHWDALIGGLLVLRSEVGHTWLVGGAACLVNSDRCSVAAKGCGWLSACTSVLCNVEQDVRSWLHDHWAKLVQPAIKK